MAVTVDPQIVEGWDQISKGKTQANWIAAEFKKTNKNFGLELFGQGEGGLNELSQKLTQLPDRVIFGILKVKFYDEKNSPYVKFVYFRFLGSKVGVMTKGALTPRLGAIDNAFPVKHISYDIDENLQKFDQKSIATAFLRVTENMVEPSRFEFGPQQIYYLQNAKNKAPASNKKEEVKQEEPEPQNDYNNNNDNNNNNNDNDQNYGDENMDANNDNADANADNQEYADDYPENPNEDIPEDN